MDETAVAIRSRSDTQAVQQATSDEGMVELWLRRRHNPNTRSAYSTDARAFRAFLPKKLCQVTVSDIEDFADSLAGLAVATRARRLSAVKSLIGYACKVGYLPLDVGAPVELPKIKDTLGERIVDEEAVQRLLWTADAARAGPYTKRNAALLRLLYGTGVRISEACGLAWRDLSQREEAGQITVFGKGGNTRVILLPKSLWDRLNALRGNAGPDDPVFRSREGSALARRQVHRVVKAAAKRAKFRAEFSAHWFRHAHALHALDRKCPVHVLQQTLGHASLQTTTRYSHARPDKSSAQYLVV